MLGPSRRTSVISRSHSAVREMPTMFWLRERGLRWFLQLPRLCRLAFSIWWWAHLWLRSWFGSARSSSTTGGAHEYQRAYHSDSQQHAHAPISERRDDAAATRQSRGTDPADDHLDRAGEVLSLA